MTLKNKSALQRAIGILDGIAWVSTDEKLTDSLISVCEMLDGIAESEEKEYDRT